MIANNLATLHRQAWLNDAVIHGYLTLARSYDAYMLLSFLGMCWQQSTSFVTHEWMYTQVQMACHKWILMPLYHYTPCPEKNGTNNVLGTTLANTNI